jgi:uncharacterized membrane protein
MTRDEFLKALRENLRGLPQNEADDIIRDQDEYIRDATASGRSEEQVVASLGDPRAFASNLSATAHIDRATKSSGVREYTSATFRAVFAVLALAPLNLIFVLGPFLGLVGILVACWGVALALTLGAGGVMMGFFAKAIFVSVGFMAHLSTFFLIAGIIGLGIIGILIMLKVTELVMRGTIAYLRWNVNFVRGNA